MLNRAGPETVRLNFNNTSRTVQETYRDNFGRTQTRDVIEYSFDGLFDQTSTLMVNSPDGISLSIIELDNRAELHHLTGHNAWITAATFSTDGKYLVSGSEDGDIIVWDVATGTLLRHLSGHTGRINVLTYSPTEAEVVSGSDDKSAVLWNVESGEAVFRLPSFGASVTNAFFNDSGSVALAYALNQDTPRVGRLIEGANPDRSFSNLGQYLGFNPKGTLGYMGGDGSGYLTLWRTDQLQEVREFKLGNANEDYIPVVAFSPDGRSVLVYIENRAYSKADEYTVRDRSIELWDIRTGERVYRLNLNEPDPNTWSISSLTFSGDGNQALIGGSFGRVNTLLVWDMNQRREMRRFTGHSSAITEVVFSPDSRYAFSTAEGNTRVWDINDRETAMIGRIDLRNTQVSQIALGTAPLQSDTLPVNPVPLPTVAEGQAVQWPVAFGFTSSGTISTWNLATAENVIVPISIGSWPRAFSPTESYVLVASTEGQMNSAASAYGI